MKFKQSWLLLLFAAAGSCLAQGAPVAGLAPYERPANAPTIVTPPPLDKARALHGVSEPKPASLKFLDDQGGWYNPFILPGMPRPYDLRGWHSPRKPVHN